MSRTEENALSEALRDLRLKHEKTIERSAKLLVEMEKSNNAAADVQRAQAVADTLPDPDKPIPKGTPS